MTAGRNRKRVFMNAPEKRRPRKRNVRLDNAGVMGGMGAGMAPAMARVGEAMKNMGVALRAPVDGSVDDIRAGVDDLVHTRIPVGVHCAGLVCSTRGGWRFRVLLVCMWVLRKTGHEVIR